MSTWMYVMLPGMCSLLSVGALAHPLVGTVAHQTSVATVMARIGTSHGDGPESFGKVEAVEMDPAGRVYVLDGLDQQVRVFGRNGGFVRSFGKSGAGPAEFRSAVGLAWAPDGSLWIPDPENLRVSVFDTAGSFLESRALTSGFTLAPWPGRFDRHGNFYHYALSRDSEWHYDMVRYGPDLMPLDTLAVPRPLTAPEYFEGREPRGGVVRARVPYTPRMVWRLSSRGELWAVWTADYAVFRLDRAGRRHVIVEHAAERVAVTRQERDAAIAGLNRHAMVLDASRVPRYKPYVRTFVLDDQDRVWVIPYARESDDETQFDVFSANGDFMGRVIVPVVLESVPVPIVRNWTICGIVRDDLGTESVVVVRARPLAERR